MTQLFVYYIVENTYAYHNNTVFLFIMNVYD